MEKRPYTLKYVRPALKWCLTWHTPEPGNKKTERMNQHQEWFEDWEEADKRGREVTKTP